MEEIKKQMTKIQLEAVVIGTSQQVLRCDFFAGDHPNGICSTTKFIQEDQANFMSRSRKPKNLNLHQNSS